MNCQMSRWLAEDCYWGDYSDAVRRVNSQKKALLVQSRAFCGACDVCRNFE
jgi:hypothetical protein